MRIAGGERIYSPAQYRMLAERGAIHVFQPDATLCGGILACLEIAAVAQQYGLEVIPHVGGPTAIGLAANLQWAAAAERADDRVGHRPAPAARRQRSPPSSR